MFVARPVCDMAAAHRFEHRHQHPGVLQSCDRVTQGFHEFATLEFNAGLKHRAQRRIERKQIPIKGQSSRNGFRLDERKAFAKQANLLFGHGRFVSRRPGEQRHEPGLRTFPPAL